MLFASGQLEECIEQFARAEESGCDRIDLFLSRGAAYMALGRYDDARDDFSRVLQEDTNNERAYYFRGVAHAALALYQEAVDDLTQSLVRNHKRGVAHLLRGVAYSELGMEQDAILDFNTASAFSEAEQQSFHNLFGNMISLSPSTRDLLSRENAPWNNALPKDAAQRLNKLLH